MISPELIGNYWTAKAMQNSWIKHTVAFLNSVPSGVQAMVMLIITEIVILSIDRILGIDTLEFRKPLFRDEKLYNSKYGVVYRIAYNMMVVDLICKGDKEFMAYERVLPNGKNDVVILSKRNGKYTLLKQFRHAIMIKQYACPRGFLIQLYTG